MEDNSLCIDVICQEHPNGQVYATYCGVEKLNSFFGTAIPVKNQQYQMAYVSDHIFIYPLIITCRILQEALRVAQQVYIFPTSDSIRIPWHSEKILLPQAAKQHLHCEANDLFSFIFVPCENNMIKVTPIFPLNDC